MENDIQFTIVTVCKNEKSKIVKTIESVIQQDYANMEYLIIDGASEDGTKEIIWSYAQKDKRIKVISEPDDGIYNAMNKAISLAKGDYINFMNAGDSFTRANVLGKVDVILRKRYPDILCGEAIFYATEDLCKQGVNFHKKVTILRMENKGKLSCTKVLRGIWGCHQAVFAKKDTLRQYYFNEKYKIVADYDWFVRNIKDKREIEYNSIKVCNFIGDGISWKSENASILAKENDAVVRQHYGIVFAYIRRFIKWYRKSNMKKWKTILIKYLKRKI